jgi:hypothetical protein
MAQVIAYLDCHSGISGNMFLGAMLDAGLELDTLKKALSSLPLSGYELQLERFQDKGIQGTRFDVVLREQQQQTRHLSDIVALLGASKLSARVQEMAIAVFSRLAEAEAVVHGTSIEEVHFHEVGAIDAIVDITGAAIAVEALGITQLYASPLPMSSGHVQTSHGLLPVPAPATLEILRRVGAPWKPCPVEGELVTPTGAAILATMAQFQTPAMAIERVGYGFGHKQFPWPNCLRVCLGKSYGPVQGESGSADSDWVTVIETNIDNMTGELLGGLMDRLLVAGALDVSYIPMQMKKNRPAVMLAVICRTEETDAMAQLLLGETSTLGVRIQQVQRLKAQRSQQQIDTPVGTVMVKVKRIGARIISASPEYEDCRRIASERGISLEEVYDLARQAIEMDLLK